MGVYERSNRKEFQAVTHLHNVGRTAVAVVCAYFCVAYALVLYLPVPVHVHPNLHCVIVLSNLTVWSLSLVPPLSVDTFANRTCLLKRGLLKKNQPVFCHASCLTWWAGTDCHIHVHMACTPAIQIACMLRLHCVHAIFAMHVHRLTVPIMRLQM